MALITLQVTRLAAQLRLKDMIAQNLRKDMIKFQSLRFNLASPEASFVAVESDEIQPITSPNNPESTSPLIDPVSAFQGWGRNEGVGSENKLSIEERLYPVGKLVNTKIPGSVKPFFTERYTVSNDNSASVVSKVTASIASTVDKILSADSKATSSKEEKECIGIGLDGSAVWGHHLAVDTSKGDQAVLALARSRAIRACQGQSPLITLTALEYAIIITLVTLVIPCLVSNIHS